METRVCQNCKNSFTIEPEDLKLIELVKIPIPKQCVLCLWKNLLAFYVFGRFRKRTSALSGKRIITVFGEDARFPIYDREEWLSDAWDPLAYGMDYDKSRPFLSRFGELHAKVPRPHQLGVNNRHCEWSDDVWESKECYLCRSLLRCENLSYSYRVLGCKNSVDLNYCFDTELSYDCSYCFNCYKVRYGFDVSDSLESAFLYDCHNVQNCFMCWNLRNKQYHILNQPYGKEEYFKKIKEFDLGSRKQVEELKEKFQEVLSREAFYRDNFVVNSVNSRGNFLADDKNCHNCFFLEKSEDCRHAFKGFGSKDSIYFTGSMIERGAFSVCDVKMYETIATSRSNNCRYSAYLDYCEDCEYCFGCVGLRKKKYCILNKQYSKDEYLKIIEEIKAKMEKDGEWGNFFPYDFAHGGYNESHAQIFFPETMESMQKIGGRWTDDLNVSSDGMPTESLPDNIKDVSEEIAKQALICPATKQRFNISLDEFKFYKTHNIPLPRFHFDYRTGERIKRLTAVIPNKGFCFDCKKEIVHYYPLAWNYQRILCSKCYQDKMA